MSNKKTDHPKGSKKLIGAWALYDWANSTFYTTVVAGFFPIFFEKYWSNPSDVVQSTYQLGLANSLASIIVAFLSPFLGAVADRGSAKKKFLIIFAFFGALMTDLGEKITEQFIINVFENIVDISDKIQNNNNYKDMLLRYYQQQQWGHPRYKQLSVEQTKINSHHYCNIYTVAVYNHDGSDTVGIGKGKSKKTAEQMASKNTLLYFNYFDKEE